MEDEVETELANGITTLLAIVCATNNISRIIKMTEFGLGSTLAGIFGLH